jgi:tetratricopeptide (TPR) repeat protein
MRNSFLSSPRTLSVIAACALFVAASPVAAQLRDEPKSAPKVQPDTDRLPPRQREFVVPPPGDKPTNKPQDKNAPPDNGKRSEAPGKKRAEPPKDKLADGGPLDHKGPGGIIETPAKQPVKRALGAVIPDAPIERAKLLRDLYAHLATAADEQAAAPFVEAIERIWLAPGSDTVLALMERALFAASHERPDLALNLLDAVVNIAPDYAEGFNRRAYVFYTLGDRERALGDLRRVLALDPNHFKAIDGFAQIMKDFGDKKAALAAYQKLVSIHPFWPSAQTAFDELKKEVEGQGL